MSCAPATEAELVAILNSWSRIQYLTATNTEALDRFAHPWGKATDFGIAKNVNASRVGHYI